MLIYGQVYSECVIALGTIIIVISVAVNLLANSCPTSIALANWISTIVNRGKCICIVIVIYNMIFLCGLCVATGLLVAYMAPAIRRFKQRYDFAQTLPGPSIFDFIAASRSGSEENSGLRSV